MSQSEPARPRRGRLARLRAGLAAHEAERDERLREPPLLPARFRFVRELGRGGMGVVVEAHDRELERPVAIKVLRADLSGEGEAARRFRREARALASLRHAHVVRLHEMLEHAGRTCLVLERVEGESLAARLERAGPLAAREAARIALALAEALAAVHGAGILHRDLKPGNVLLDAHDAPRLGDFGLARLARDSLSSPTRTGQILGTPGFMAPEQARGERGVDARGDLFGLGATLVAMLRGAPPRARVEVPATAPPDLQTILRACLAEDPARRYPDAEHLAADLRAYLAGDPLTPPTASPRPLRWWRRQRGLGLSVALALPLLAGAALAVAFSGRTPALPDAPRATPRGVSSRPVRTPAGTGSAAPAWVPLASLSLSGLRGADFVVGAPEQVVTWTLQGRILLWDWRNEQLLGEYRAPQDALQVVAAPEVLAVAGTGGLHLGDPQDPAGWTLPVSDERAQLLRVSPDGTALAVGTEGGDVWLVDLPAGTRPRRVGTFPVPVRVLAFSPDGRRLAAGAGSTSTRSPRPELRSWSLPRGDLLHSVGLQASPTALGWSPDGAQLLLADNLLHLAAYEADTLQRRRSWSQPELASTEGPTATRIVGMALRERIAYTLSGGPLDRLRLRCNALGVWDVGAGRLLGTFLETQTTRYGSLSLSRDGEHLLVAANEEGRARVWPTAALPDARDTPAAATSPTPELPREPLATLRHKGVRGACFLPDAPGRIASWGDAEGVQVWDWEEERLHRRWFGPWSTQYLVARGARLVAGGSRGVFRIDLGVQDAITVLLEAATVHSLALQPGGDLLAVGTEQGNLWLLDFPGGGEPRRLHAFGEGVRALAFSPDGTRLLAAAGTTSTRGKPPELRLWSVPGGELLQTTPLEARPTAAIWGPRGERCLLSNVVLELTEFDAATLRPLRLWARPEYSPPNPAAATRIRALARRGRTVYTVSAANLERLGQRTNALGVWDVAAGRLLGTFFATQRTRYLALDLSPDGKQLLLAETDSGQVSVWPTAGLPRAP